MNHCRLCNRDGYRPNGYICDHIDHRPAYERGMAAVRSELEASRRKSARPTFTARREAYERQQLVDRQRAGFEPPKEVGPDAP